MRPPMSTRSHALSPLVCLAALVLCALPAAPRVLAHAQFAPCFYAPPKEGGHSCYYPADRAAAESSLEVPPVNPDPAVAQAVGPQLPLTRLMASSSFTVLRLGTPPPPVTLLEYFYTPPGTITLDIGCLGVAAPIPQVVIVREVVGYDVQPSGVGPYYQGGTLCGWGMAVALPGRNLTLEVISNVSADAVAAIAQAMVQEAASLPPLPTATTTSIPTSTSTPTATALPPTPSATATVTPTATAMATVTPTAIATVTPTATVAVTATPTVTTTVTATPTLALALSLSGARQGTLTLQVRTAPRARVRLSLQVRRVSVAAHVRGLRAAATPARWTTVLAQQGAADARGQLRRVLRLPHGLARAASVRVLVLARVGGRTAARQATVRLGR